MKEFSYREIESATSGFAVERLIGKGSHGRVYRGTLRGGKEVAVKISPEINEPLVLASLRGPNIVKLLGVAQCPMRKQQALVMELMPYGSLDELLHSSSSTPPSWRRRAAIALQIAQAVRWMHEATPPIIHRDVKSANILFDRRWNARLADFSLAVRESSEATSTTVMPAGTFGYLDPAYTVPGKLSTHTDVFSFGVVLLELVSGRRAMDVDHHPASIVTWAVPVIKARQYVHVRDVRMEVVQETEGTVARVLELAARCVSAKEKRRPTMAELVVELEEVMAQLRWGLSGRVYRCICSWRRWRKTKVFTSKIICKDHLIDGEEDDDDKDDDDYYKIMY